MAKQNDIKRMSNVEWLTHICEFSDHGALMQIFVLDGLSKWADHIVECGREAVVKSFDNGAGRLIDGNAWYDTAVELQRRFEERTS